MKKIKKSIWLTAILMIYFLAMTAFYGPELVKTGQTTRLITVAAVEIVVLIALYFFLKKRERLG